MNTLHLKIKDRTFKRKWDSRRKSYMKKKSGGAVRVRGHAKQVSKAKKVVHELEDPEKEFWTLKAYEKEFGTAKDTKATIAEMDDKEGKNMKGVLVAVGKPGVSKVRGQSAPRGQALRGGWHH